MNFKNSQEVINKCFYDETIKIVKYIYENSEEDKLNFDQLEKQFKSVFFGEAGTAETTGTTETAKSAETPKKTPKKPAKKTVKKPVEEAEQCIALKKDGARCKGKKLKTGKNPLICSLHNNSGIKNGTIDTEKNKCGYAYLSEERIDTTCENDEDEDSNNCKLHDAVLDTTDASGEESSYEEDFQ